MVDRSNILKRGFQDIRLEDPFFDSLRASYSEFDVWFTKKADQGEEAYVMLDDSGSVQAFLYLKEETGPINDIDPPLNTERCLKIGTFKINAHGTKLGERFVKKVFDEALVGGFKHIYTTIFPAHEGLIDILKKYGFNQYGSKTTENGIEKVFLKDLSDMSGSYLINYPVIDARKCNKWLLAIYPKWHTKLFPDSILNTEESSIVDDLSETNSIHKVYIAWMRGMDQIRAGDCLLIYRTREGDKSGWYSSVATSICVVEDARSRSSFADVDDLIEYAERHSVFNADELKRFYNTRPGMHVLKMTYNVALPKRPNRQKLVEDAGIDGDVYAGFMKLTDDQFKRIVEMGQVYEGVVVH